MLAVIILGLIGFVAGFEELPENFTGFSVLKATVQNAQQAHIIKELEDKMQVNLWNEPRMDINLPVLMSVPPNLVKKVKTQLTKGSMKPEVVVHDLQKMIDKEKMENTPSERERRQESFEFGRYHNLNEITEFLKGISSSYSNLASVITIGHSFESRPIQGLRITSGEIGIKPAIFLEVGIHSREWVTTASALYFINELTAKYGSDAEIKQLVDDYEWYIIPSANPDGYVYTWNVNRQWRKTRSGSWFCTGVDANRNFDINFCGRGSSSDPCSDTYCGPFAFSERESQALRNITTQLGSRLKLYIAIHSYGQLWMYPYGYTTKEASNKKELERLAVVGTTALRKRYSTSYTQGPISKVIYVASGSSIDWVYDIVGTQLAYALEVRDKGQHGFILPKEQIIPTAQETWDGIKALIQAM